DFALRERAIGGRVDRPKLVRPHRELYETMLTVRSAPLRAVREIADQQRQRELERRCVDPERERRELAHLGHEIERRVVRETLEEWETRRRERIDRNETVRV